MIDYMPTTRWTVGYHAVRMNDGGIPIRLLIPALMSHSG